MPQKIAILTSADLSKVQGSTEARYVTSFLAEEYETHIYSPHDPIIDGLRHHRIPSASRVPAFILYNLFLLPYFIYHSVVYEYDVVYTYKGFHLTPFLLSTTGTTWIADLRTKPVKQSEEWSNIKGTDDIFVKLYHSMGKLVYKTTLPEADAIVTLSEPISDHLQKYYSIDSSSIYIVPLAVDSKIFKPSKLQRDRTEPLDIVYIGSIVPHRKIDICVDALASDELNINARLNLVGEGDTEYLNEIKSKTRKKGINEKVNLFGYVDHEDIPDVLDKMDVAISPLPAHDSFEVSSPAKIYEYLAMGLPIICSDIQAHRQILSDGEIGFFFQPESVASLVSAINIVGGLESDDWKYLQQKAREKGEENDWSHRMTAIDNIIHSHG